MEGRFNIFIFCLILLFTSTTLALSSAEFNSNGWKRFREIHIPAEVKEGPVGIALESELLEKCRPDLADIRVVSSGSTAVPILITEASDGEDAAPFPAQVFRVTKRPGKFTEIWIDKKAKVLTRAVIVQTSSKDFARKVELRGSRNARDSYVIRVDGLIADLVKPVPLQSLDIEHPVNSFQYLQLRILDEDQPSLKIDNVLCCPANVGVNLTKNLELQITEKGVTGSNSVEFDLGQKRFPLTSVRISSKTKEFIKTIRIAGRSSANGDPWKDFYDGTLFRIHKEDTLKEKLQAEFKPQLYRYVKLELLGSRPTVSVDEIQAIGAVRMAVFEHRKDLTYRIYYDNGQAKPQFGKAPSVTNLGHIAALSSEIKLSGELKVPEAPVVIEPVRSEEASTQSILRKFVGMALLLLGLLILFIVMLRTRGLRRREVSRNSRSSGDRDQFKISLREH
ncbi:MAG: DUF3999 family protein [Desulfomonilaceae bacterium]